MSTVFGQFEKSVREFPDKKAIGFFEQDELTYWTYREFHDKILALSESLRKHNLKKGDRLAILAPNGPAWALIYLAAARLGLVVIPIHTTLSGSQIRRIIEQSKVKYLALGQTDFTESFDVLQELLPNLFSDILRLMEVHLPSVELVILLREPIQRLKDQNRSVNLPELIAHGNLLLEGRNHSGRKGPKPIRIRPSDTFLIIYTSGTTGEMKGVMLTQQNLVSNALAMGKLNGVTSKDVALSLLPLSHAFEQTAGFLHQLFYGTTVVYGRGPSHLLEDLRLVRPTWMAVVPRILEKVCQAIHQGIRQNAPWATGLFQFGVRQGKVYHRLKKENHPFSSLVSLSHQAADKIFFRKIRDQLGGKLNRLASGGAPLDPDIAHFFECIGIKVLEGYGLTEASPTVAVNPAAHPKIGSVGLPLPNLSVKIGENDEVLVKGPSVMKGYEGNPQATRRAIDPGGWLHTGDQGYLDEDGYLYITGRIKEILVTSYGKNIVPGPIEKQLEASPWIKQAMIYGDKRPFVVALVVPEAKKVQGDFHDGEYFHMTWKELCQHSKVQESLAREVEKYSRGLAQPEKPKKILVLAEEFTESNSCLTPTLKLRRKNIEERYRDKIEGLYR